MKETDFIFTIDDDVSDSAINESDFEELSDMNGEAESQVCIRLGRDSIFFC